MGRVAAISAVDPFLPLTVCFRIPDSGRSPIHAQLRRHVGLVEQSGTAGFRVLLADSCPLFVVCPMAATRPI